MADYLLDSDVLIWHLRGHSGVREIVVDLFRQGAPGISVITRAEVLQGARRPELEATLHLLDVCEALIIDTAVADRAAALVREGRSAGRTLHLPDALIASTALGAGVPLYSCNAGDFDIAGLDLRRVSTAT